MNEERKKRAVELIVKRDFLALKEMLKEMYPADAELLFEEIDEKERIIVFRLLPKELAAEIFVEMDSDMQETLIKTFTDKELHDVLSELYIDDTVDIVEEMPANVVDRILRASDPGMRNDINRILQYPKNSAGSVMTTEYIKLRPTMTVSDAFAKIRREGVNSETIYTCYVTEVSKLIGVVTVKDMLLASPDAVIGNIMETEVISAVTHDDREKAAQLLSKYDFLSLPVVDTENRLVGIITVDDAIDVMRDEATEDIEKMAAITPTDKPYLKTGVFSTWLKRIPWLVLLMISATFTSRIIGSYEDALSKLVILTAFIPMLMDTGGNAGSQAAMTIIRGLSIGEIVPKDIFRIFWKEIRVALLCGLTLALVGFVKLMIVDRAGVAVACVVALTMCVTIIAAKAVGCTLPLLAKKIGFDPAVMASPFITTIVDAISLLIYFCIATAMLPALSS